MSNAKRGFKALGLSLLAAMGLMAFVAGGAQAETWDLNGKEITGHMTGAGNLKAGQTALLLVPALNLVIHCDIAEIHEILFYPSLPPKAHANIKYDKCLTLIKGVDSPGCNPEILLVKTAILPILHNGKVYLLVEPLVLASPFTQIHYNEATCALPPLPAVTGHVVFQCENVSLVQESCSVSKVRHLIKPAPPALFPLDTLKYGLNAAEIHGEAEVFLTGADTGIAFAALV